MDEETSLKLRQYAGLLSAANARARLTGPSDPGVLYDEHIADALPAVALLPKGCSFVDVGTGGGLPGLVWCLCRQDVSGVLLDSVGKKTALLAEMTSELGCRNTEVVNMRSEDFARLRRESFDAATARAVADARVLAEYLSPLVRVGGKLIVFKGSGARAELGTSVKWETLGLSAPELRGYSTAGRKMFLVIWEKTRPCGARYPRKAGAAAKAPWWLA
ncbi:MAG: 16S rRNA (guanine(527)-N(7))-methyltransferase RsmG [Synergistaceae bacterium]|jgi:16S rRNA (guanine527-N7)-methyltransferase|nr:16S rRNA (guanine(527)-N(7))-methyltransferase RsmG [Synergistaceae bacterium]